MYRAEQKDFSSDDGVISVWGISDDDGFIFDFTTDNKKAEEIADVLNKNKVERVNVAEIIEDLFY